MTLSEVISVKYISNMTYFLDIINFAVHRFQVANGIITDKLMDNMPDSLGFMKSDTKNNNILPVPV